MLSGDNGILQKATDAKTKSNESQIKERMQLAYLSGISNKNATITEDSFKQELIKEFGTSKVNDDTIVTSQDGKTWTVTIDSISENFLASQSTPVVTSNLSDAEKTALQTNGIGEITGDEITNHNLKNNNRIKAVITGNVPLTTEMTYVTGTKDTGVVVSIDENEFVWVPVPVVINYDLSTINTNEVDLVANPNTERPRPMSKLQSGSTENYEGLFYEFIGSTSRFVQPTSSAWKEPAFLTNSSYADTSSYNTIGLTGEKLQAEYNKMVESVNKYGGFYVARYELGLEGTNPVSKPASETVTTADANNLNTSSWYGLYAKINTMYQETGTQNIVSQMIWGSQYDAMMNWMAKTGTSVGTVDNTKKNETKITGRKAEDVINNVKDLYGCHNEWTQQGHDNGSTGYRVDRGGPAANGSNGYPCRTDDTYSSRATLYIKQ